MDKNSNLTPQEFHNMKNNKLDKQILKDSFNIVQSAVRSRVGEKFWCEG